MTARRRTGAALSVALVAFSVASAFAGCGDADGADDGPRGTAAGRLTARPGAGEGPGGATPGLSELAVPGGRPALLLVPPEAAGGARVPLVVALHGAGSSARTGMRLGRKVAAATGGAVLAPSSHASTWDVIVGGFGPDAAAIDELLRRVARRVPVDPERVVVAGFSDGASYALSLGLANGDLFRAVLAFSPGFAAPGQRRGRPPILVTHGVDDRILPIDRTSRRLVPRLRHDGYHVVYREFEGGHEVPQRVMRRALGRLLP